MGFIQPDKWPVWVMLGIAAIAAVINDQKGARLPNALTLPFILSGWLLAALHNLGFQIDGGTGGLGAALAGTVLAFVLFLPLYSRAAIGAGSVKLQMGLGAWLGAYYSYTPGLSIVFWATVVAAVVALIVIAAIHVVRTSGSPRFLPTGVYQLVGVVGALVSLEAFGWLPGHAFS